MRGWKAFRTWEGRTSSPRDYPDFDYGMSHAKSIVFPRGVTVAAADSGKSPFWFCDTREAALLWGRILGYPFLAPVVAHSGIQRDSITANTWTALTLERVGPMERNEESLEVGNAGEAQKFRDVVTLANEVCRELAQDTSDGFVVGPWQFSMVDFLVISALCDHNLVLQFFALLPRGIVFNPTFLILQCLAGHRHRDQDEGFARLLDQMFVYTTSHPATAARAMALWKQAATNKQVVASIMSCGLCGFECMAEWMDNNLGCEEKILPRIKQRIEDCARMEELLAEWRKEKE